MSDEFFFKAQFCCLWTQYMIEGKLWTSLCQRLLFLNVSVRNKVVLVVVLFSKLGSDTWSFSTPKKQQWFSPSIVASLLGVSLSSWCSALLRGDSVAFQRAFFSSSSSPRGSDPDDWCCGCEGHSGARVVLQVDHGVVGGAQAAKGSSCAHLSVPQTLQVALLKKKHK